MALREDISADVVIVGGGFTGLSAALHLAERGTDVVLLEAAEPGWGASGRNGGQVIPGFKLELAELVSRYGEEKGRRLFAAAGTFPDLVFDLIERHQIECAAARAGWIQGAHCTSAHDHLERRCDSWAALGAPVEMLDRVETAHLLGTEWYTTGFIDRRGGGLNPLGYARGLAHAAIAAGARIHGQSTVQSIEQEGGAWLVRTAGGAARAQNVLLATNGYSYLAGGSGPWPKLAESIIPVHSYQVATRPLSDNIRRTILPEGQVSSDLRRLLVYFRLDPEGRFVMGGRGGLDGSLDRAKFAGVIASIRDLFPQIGDPDLAFFWNGQIAINLDHMPHIHPLAEGALAGLGFNGRGVAAATAMGKALADKILGVADDDLPFPVEPLKAIPFHGLRLPAMHLAVAWKRFRDAQERRSG